MKKYLISILFTIAACVAAGSVGAQTWSGGSNFCSNAGHTSTYSCVCPNGWTFANAVNANCGFNDGTAGGCWNPTTGTCSVCGENSTVALGSTGCFGGSNGQNSMGIAPESTDGSACTQNSDCLMWDSPGDPTTGGGCNFYYPYTCYSSDIRLKRDIVLLGQTDKGIKLYSFKYLSSDQVYVGVMAQDLLENPKWQDAVITNPTGYYSVIYSKLGLEMVTLEQYQQVSAVALVK
jgi:hypothetical protein